MATKPALVDMAYTKADKKEEAKEYAVGPGGQISDYPWGLCLSLEKKELDKLGVKQLPQVGGEFHFVAVAKVTSVNQSAREGQDGESRVGLQITMMQVVLEESAAEEKAEKKETPKTEARETPSILSSYKG